MSAESTLREETRKRLADFLRGLPASHARALAESVEQARRAGDTQLPHQLILEALQPVLRRQEKHPPQRVTAERFFCRPFEDLIVDDPAHKLQGRIARASVAPVWKWLSEELAPHLRDGPEAGGVPGATDESAAAGFYAACAKALGGAFTDTRDHGAIAARLGGETVLEDARDITAILEIADDALEIQERFPRPVTSLPTLDLNLLVLLFDDFVDRHPERVAHLFFLIMGRLAKPWDVLRVMSYIAGRVHSGRPDSSDTNAVMELLQADLDADAEFFRCLNTAAFDPDEVASRLRSFTRMVNGLSQAAGLPADGVWARRMMNDRSLVAEKMEIMMERVPRDISAALPVHKIGRFGRVRRRPDIGTPPDAAKAGQALRMAGLVDAGRPYAADGAFKVAFSEAVADTREALNEYASALIEEMKRLDADSIAPAQAYLDLVIRLTADVSGPEEAGRLRRDWAALRPEGLPDAAVS